MQWKKWSWNFNTNLFFVGMCPHVLFAVSYVPIVGFAPIALLKSPLFVAPIISAFCYSSDIFIHSCLNVIKDRSVFQVRKRFIIKSYAHKKILKDLLMIESDFAKHGVCLIYQIQKS